jgi:phosphoribosylformylglycinamidine (FGAM) synthase PurS component
MEKKKLIARVIVTLKPWIPDAVGLMRLAELRGRGFTEVASVRSGKIFEVETVEMTHQEAEQTVKGMCEELPENVLTDPTT